MSLSIEMLILSGAISGLIIGLVSSNPKIGVYSLLCVPVSAIAYTIWWQSQNPDALRSTSGLDFFFNPLWPSFGALIGFVVGILLRSSFSDH